MINVKRAKQFCREDISLIENYNEAVSSPEKWVCHHRRGLDEMNRTELKKKGLYTKRPASELIFLTEAEHDRIHKLGERHPLFGKFGDKHPMFGHHHTESTIEKMRHAKLGEKNPMYGRTGEKNTSYGKHWFNNGIENVFTHECPPGFVPGLLLRSRIVKK